MLKMALLFSSTGHISGWHDVHRSVRRGIDGQAVGAICLHDVLET